MAADWEHGTATLWRGWGTFFFFKQKTAYEIGLGIPAEPLFRSSPHLTILSKTDALDEEKWLNMLGRSEERRVGKECRSRWMACHETKNRIKLYEGRVPSRPIAPVTYGSSSPTTSFPSSGAAQPR